MRLWGVLLPLLCLGQELPYRVEAVSAKHHFLDGPAWSSHDAHLIFSDVPANTVHRLDAKGSAVIQSDARGGNSGAAFDDRGRLHVCESRARRVVRLDKKGSPEVIAETFEGKKLNGPNDIVIAKNGHGYFTDPAFGAAQESRELPFYGVFHVTPRGSVTVEVKLQTRPNGLAITSDGKTLYVANSDERNIRAYHIGNDGALENERIFIAKIDGVPNGIEVDESGNVYVAASNIEVFAPTAERIASIHLAEKPSNLVFGDADLKSLYVTAGTMLFRVRFETVKGVSLY